jgi:hypothetical protein
LAIDGRELHIAFLKRLAIERNLTVHGPHRGAFGTRGNKETRDDQQADPTYFLHHS